MWKSLFSSCSWELELFSLKFRKKSISLRKKKKKKKEKRPIKKRKLRRETKTGCPHFFSQKTIGLILTINL